MNAGSRGLVGIVVLVGLAVMVAIVVVGSNEPADISDKRPVPQNASDSAGGPVLVGQHGQFMREMAGCPSINELDQLAKDAVAQDRFGFYEHMAAYGCLTFAPSETALVVDGSGFLPLYLKVRLDLNQRTYWFEDDPGVFVRHADFRPGRMAEITQDLSVIGGACARGLELVPSSQIAGWMTRYCLDVPVGSKRAYPVNPGTH